jgi:dTDP-4-amino-4,6-dideoxygalactose transaminase
MPESKIPFNKPVHLGTELDALAQAIHVNAHTAGGGPFGRRCEALLERSLGRKALLVSSCTHALEMMGLLLRLQPGDEFIVPSFTFVSTANAFILRGAKPVFVDCDLNGNITPEEVSRAITSRTRAIVAVHYAGASADLSALVAVAGKVPLVEDAAQGVTSAFDGKPLGTFGVMGALSFHETKNVGAGEGGALILNDEALVERAEYLREKGTNRRRFLNGIVDKYTWVDEGSSYVLSDLNAAYLWTQLSALEHIQARRRQLWNRYEGALSPALTPLGIHIIREGPKVTSNQHLFGLVLRSGGERAAFIEHMRRHDIMTPFHYVSLHTSPMGARFHDGRALPMTDRLSECLVRLPLFFNLTDNEQQRVIDCTQDFFHGKA